jgi:hypothetical protein
MKSLLYQALQPSSDHPYGRRPDILRVDHSFSFAVLQRQGLFQQLQIAVERSPFQQQGTVERLFDELRLSLHEHFSAFSNRDAEKAGETPLGSLHHISLPQLDNVCSQWARLFSQPLQGRQPQLEFFDYCQTRWQLFPVDPHQLALLLI